MIIKTFKISKTSDNLNSFVLVIVSYLLIVWDSINFFINSFYNYEKIGIVIFNIICLILLYLYYKSFKIEVDTYTYKYKYDEYLIEILKSFTLIFKTKKNL